MGASVKVDVAELTRWAKTGASQAEIADRLGVSRSTMDRRLKSNKKYREALVMGRAEMCISLRAKQVQVGLSGNVTMLKWLGEQYLGQAHAHRFVDKDGDDKEIFGIDAVREYMRQAPWDGETKKGD